MYRTLLPQQFPMPSLLPLCGRRPAVPLTMRSIRDYEGNYSSSVSDITIDTKVKVSVERGVVGGWRIYKPGDRKITGAWGPGWVGLGGLGSENREGNNMNNDEKIEKTTERKDHVNHELGERR